MNVIRKRCGNAVGLAVIRGYAPARIEHELLAWVFEIVEHRAAVGSVNACRSNSLAGRLPDDVARYGHGAVSPAGTNSDGPAVQEEAA